MQFQTPLIPARLIRRYKRFLADVELDTGETVTAHCPNPGAMTGMNEAGTKVWLEPNDDPKKKLKYGWRLAELADGSLINIDTSLPNKLVQEALLQNRIPELAAYDTILPEQKYGEKSRVDFLLCQAGLPDLYLEVKSVTLMRRAPLAEFPDTKTARGARHMDELAAQITQGHRAMVLFVIGHTGCSQFAVAGDIDPTYHTAFKAAREQGVEALCYGCDITPAGLTLTVLIS